MTPKIRWPNAADSARTNAIARSRKILNQLEPLKEAIEQGKPISSTELSWRFGRISDLANNIIIELIQVGPQEFLEDKQSTLTD